MTGGHSIGGITVHFNPYLSEDELVMMCCGLYARDDQSARNVFD